MSRSVRLLLVGLTLSLATACVTPRPLMLGQSMDEVALPRLAGGTRSLDELRGQVVLVDVWASWCRPCVESLPFYADLENALSAKGFRFVGINIDVDKRAAAAFLKEESLSLETLLDPGAKFIGPRFKITRMPTAFLLDRAGNIRHVHEGFASADKARWRAEIDTLLAEPSP